MILWILTSIFIIPFFQHKSIKIEKIFLSGLHLSKKTPKWRLLIQLLYLDLLNLLDTNHARLRLADELVLCTDSSQQNFQNKKSP